MGTGRPAKSREWGPGSTGVHRPRKPRKGSGEEPKQLRGGRSTFFAPCSSSTPSPITMYTAFLPNLCIILSKQLSFPEEGEGGEKLVRHREWRVRRRLSLCWVHCPPKGQVFIISPSSNRGSQCCHPHVTDNNRRRREVQWPAPGDAAEEAVQGFAAALESMQLSG